MHYNVLYASCKNLRLVYTTEYWIPRLIPRDRIHYNKETKKLWVGSQDRVYMFNLSNDLTTVIHSEQVKKTKNIVLSDHYNYFVKNGSVVVFTYLSGYWKNLFPLQTIFPLKNFSLKNPFPVRIFFR